MNLTDAQKDAVKVSAPAFQILACAGSGKTEVLARRTVRYLLEGTRPDAIIAFTFTEKAAGELRDRIEQRASEADQRFRALPPTASGLFVGTIHSYCLRLLQQYGGIYEVFDPLDEEREWALLHRFARRLGLVDLMAETWPGRPVSVRRSTDVFRRSLAVAYNDRISRSVLRERVPAFAAAVEKYEELLTRMQLISFDQMIDKVCEEMKLGCPLRKTLDGRVKEVLVDEYQDLNRSQEELLRTLVDMGARLTVVGDDDQAIYQWRGGDVSLSLRFPARYGNAQRVELLENHRSRPPIISIASGFAATIGDRVSKSMIATREHTGPAIELVQANTFEEEAVFLARHICCLLDAGHKPADIALLFRSVRTSARPFVEALRREAIPVALAGRLSLLDRQEMALPARIFVWWAGGVWRPDEDQEVVTAERLVTDIMEPTGVNETRAAMTVGELERMGRDLSANGVRDLIGIYLQMLKILGLPVEGPEMARQERGLGRLSELLADFEHAQRRAAPTEWLRTATSSASEEVTEDLAVLAVTPEAETKPTVRPGLPPGEVFLTRLRIFLEQFASQAAEESPVGPTLDQDAVNVMTIHQAKGLEFPIVFVPALVDRRFPSARMGREQLWYIPDDLFEKDRYQGREDDERRLFYVAMTRARELAVFSWFTQYTHGPAKCSRFVADLVGKCDRGLFCKPTECKPGVTLRGNGRKPTLETDFGQLVAFSECPYKYYLNYVCGFRRAIVPELGFGKFLHHAVAELARRCRDGNPPIVAEVEQILSRAFYLPFAGPIAQEKLFKAARRRLIHYVRSYGQELRRTIEPEWRFEVPMQLARIHGRIDLLLRAEGGAPEDVELVDFKTSANRPPSKQHQNQLRMYGEAARALGMNPVRLVIHDLDAEHGGPMSVEDSERERETFRAELREWIEQIHAGSFSRKKDRKACPSCDFVRLCAR
jgi:DNA helicase-2/ATP-dependent DNA helicase PcrA